MMDISVDSQAWCTYFLIKKQNKSGIKNEIKQNQQLAEELHKPIIRKLKKKRLYSAFKDNIWATRFSRYAINK